MLAQGTTHISASSRTLTHQQGVTTIVRPSLTGFGTHTRWVYHDDNASEVVITDTSDTGMGLHTQWVSLGHTDDEVAAMKVERASPTSEVFLGLAYLDDEEEEVATSSTTTRSMSPSPSLTAVSCSDTPSQSSRYDSPVVPSIIITPPSFSPSSESFLSSPPPTSSGGPIRRRRQHNNNLLSPPVLKKKKASKNARNALAALDPSKVDALHRTNAPRKSVDGAEVDEQVVLGGKAYSKRAVRKLMRAVRDAKIPEEVGEGFRW